MSELAGSGDNVELLRRQVDERWAVLNCLDCMRTATEIETTEEAWARLIPLHAAHTGRRPNDGE